MTDLEKVVDLFRSFGLEPRVGTRSHGGQTVGEPCRLGYLGETLVISFSEEDETPHFEGYAGFGTHWTFTPDGKFHSVEAWE